MNWLRKVFTLEYNLGKAPPLRPLPQRELSKQDHKDFWKLFEGKLEEK